MQAPPSREWESREVGKDSARRGEGKYRESLIRILIAPLSIPESQTKPEHHNSNWRQQ